MTAQSHSTRRKLSLLKLAEELQNVSKACRIMGYHRDSFSEIRRAFQVGGVQALVEAKRGPRHPHPNRVSPEIEARILDYALAYPTHGAQRVANELRLQDVTVSASGVRGVWLRHDLETRTKRLLRLEQTAQDDTIVLSATQLAFLERHSVDFRCRHVEASRPGELLNQDTFYWGTLKGVGKVYVQVVVDVFCSLAFAKVYSSKMPVTACELLYDRVLPFDEQLGVPVGAILTDNGREFCGREEPHPYELLLAMEGIEHRTTRVRSPRTNGFVERMNRTLLDECFRVRGRTTWYLEIAEIQRDLDAFLAYSNLDRSHQGYRLRGRTPAQALREALGVT
ncbi:MAG TPA: IS481 family transposase, partial [Candidatus Limnocylindria bacterium]|nr:IS481 family transposase [Candidatus Limnocylindria bacterium]